MYRAIRARAVKTQTKPGFTSKQLGLPVTILPSHVITIGCSVILRNINNIKHQSSIINHVFLELSK